MMRSGNHSPFLVAAAITGVCLSRIASPQAPAPTLAAVQLLRKMQAALGGAEKAGDLLEELRTP